MSILTANLKHLYQRRGLWFVYIVGCMFVPVILLGIYRFYLVDGAEGQKGGFVALLAFSNIAGLLACSMQIDIAIKPFAHCLPGYRMVKRQFVLIVGVVVSLLCSLIFLLYPGIGLSDKMMAVAAAFFAGMISYWIGTLVAFTGNASAAFLGFYPIIGILVWKYDLHIISENAMISVPGVVCVAGVIVSIGAWLALSSENWFRRHCGANWLGFFDAWNWAKVRKHSMNVKKLHDGVLSRNFEKVCLGTIRSAGGRIARYIAGSAYETFGGMFCKPSIFAATLFFLVIIVCALGYIQSVGNTIYLLAGMLAVNLPLPVHSTMLIAGGRRQKFMSTIFIAFAVSVLMSAAVTFLALITHGVEAAGILRPITFEGIEKHYKAISMLGFFVPFIMVPVGFTLQVILKRKQIPLMVAWVMFFMFCMLAAYFIDLKNIWWQGAVLIGLAVSWIVFMVVLRWYCMRRTLVV